MKHRRIKVVLSIVTLPFFLLFPSCMDYEEQEMESFSATEKGLFILNEGNFQYGNATLSYYNPDTKKVENEIFYRSNAMKLGDVAQSMTINNGEGWIVVNNSHVVFSIDLQTFKEKGRICDFTSPRYIHFVESSVKGKVEDKAYVTQLWDNRIFIVRPSSFEIIGYITIPNMSVESGSTEEMVQQGKYVFCNCWSYQNRIVKIDTETDSVVGEIVVGIGPTSVVLDKNGKLWTLTDGGYDGSPYGHESPSLICIDTKEFKIEKKFFFEKKDIPSELLLNSQGDTLYWLNESVWKMPIDAISLPSFPFIEERHTKYYGLTVDPNNGDIYVSDAIDYQQKGKVYRYSNQGILKDHFYVGLNPGAFCWK